MNFAQEFANMMNNYMENLIKSDLNEELENYILHFADLSYNIHYTGAYYSCIIYKHHEPIESYIDTSEGYVDTTYKGQVGTCKMSTELIKKINSIVESYYKRTLKKEANK